MWQFFANLPWLKMIGAPLVMRSHRFWSKTTMLALLMLTAGCVPATSQSAPVTSQPTAATATLDPAQRPNIIVIVTDDQRYDTMDFMPETKSLIFDRGVTFSTAFVTTSLCCPSRASILTGMYAHSHGVHDNSTRLLRATFVDRLHDAGYYTGFVGKYMNSWPGSKRPEFDFWIGAPQHDYINPRLNIDGGWRRLEGYQTDFLNQYALDFLGRAAQQPGPFLLYFAPHAPHAPAVPAPKDKDLYADLPLFRPPSFNEADISDKPYANTHPPLTDKQIADNDYFRLNQLRSLKNVDEGVAQLVRFLDQRGLSEKTAIFFTSDNGMLWGEHRLTRVKLFAYEPSIRVPLALYYPHLVRQPMVVNKLVANIDIAPTIYELAGLPVPPEVEGMSLLPLIRGGNAWRDYVLIENWSNNSEEADDLPSKGYLFVAIRTERYMYIENIGLPPELYDLQNDPDELQNQFDNPEYSAALADLKAGLDWLKGPYMTTLTPVPAP